MPQIQCPACHKSASRRQDLYLHFYHALSGYDHLDDPVAPHTVWATAQGITVQEGSFIRERDRDTLKEALYRSLERR